MDLSKQIEMDQRRVQERSQLAHLQGQVDELRQRLEQQAARSQLTSEQARQVQDMFTQIESKFEALVSDLRLQDQTRQRAAQSLQREVAELRVRIEEPARQILGLLSQVQDLSEGLRLLRENAGQAQEETRHLGQRIDELRAQGLLREERLARLDNLVNQLLQGEDERRQAIGQLRTDMEAERQNLRRQATDVERLAADLRGEQQELISRQNRQAELQRQASTAAKALDERFEEQTMQFDRVTAELQRIEREATESALQGQDRLETLRSGMQREWGELREAEERRGESQNAWLRRIEELYHALDGRQAKRDEELSQSLARLVSRTDMVERDLEHVLRTILDVFQKQLEEWAEERVQRITPAREP